MIDCAVFEKWQSYEVSLPHVYSVLFPPGHAYDLFDSVEVTDPYIYALRVWDRARTFEGVNFKDKIWVAETDMGYFLVFDDPDINYADVVGAFWSLGYYPPLELLELTDDTLDPKIVSETITAARLKFLGETKRLLGKFNVCGSMQLSFTEAMLEGDGAAEMAYHDFLEENR